MILTGKKRATSDTTPLQKKQTKTKKKKNKLSGTKIEFQI